MRRQRGHTLAELGVVVIILAIIALAGMRGLNAAGEQAKVDDAAAALRGIWGAERLYWLDHREYTASFDDLVAEGLLDARAVAATEPFSYAITVANSDEFVVVATRTGGVWSGEIEIDQRADLSGTVVDGEGRRVAPRKN